MGIRFTVVSYFCLCVEEERLGKGHHQGTKRKTRNFGNFRPQSVQGRVNLETSTDPFITQRVEVEWRLKGAGQSSQSFGNLTGEKQFHLTYITGQDAGGFGSRNRSRSRHRKQVPEPLGIEGGQPVLESGVGATVRGEMGRKGEGEEGTKGGRER